MTRLGKSFWWKFRIIRLTPVVGGIFVGWVWEAWALALIIMFLGLFLGFWGLYKHMDKAIEKEAENFADDMMEEYKKQRKGEN